MAENKWVNMVFFTPFSIGVISSLSLKGGSDVEQFHATFTKSSTFPGDFYVRKIDGSFDPEDQISPSNTASGLSIVILQVNPRPAQTKETGHMMGRTPPKMIGTYINIYRNHRSDDCLWFFRLFKLDLLESWRL